MDTAKSRSIWLAILLGALLMIPTPQALAQDNELPEGWEIQLIPMWMWVKGFDEHVGDEIIDIEFLDEGPPFIERDTQEINPINLEMDSNVTGRVELTFRRNQWGFGVSSWFFLTDDDERGVVRGRPEISNGTETTFEARIAMWNEDFSFDNIDDEEGNESSAPISWFADAELNTFTVDLFGLRTLAEKPASRIDLLAGVKLGWLDMELNQGFDVRTFKFDFGVGDDAHRVTFRTFRSDTDADFLGIGPMVGFAGDATWERWRVKVFITQSVLAGEADIDGLHRDTQIDFDTLDEGGGGPFELTRDSVEDHPFGKEETVFIPVTEAQIKVKYEITENIAIGLAGFTSIWIDAPAPPKFDDDTELWSLSEETLVFMGVGLDIEIMWP